MSGALVIRGEAGIGKTALLEHLIAHSSGCRVARVDGVESETELEFSALHQLCAPFLDQVDSLSPPQRDALAVSLGLKAGVPPDGFLVGIAVLSLLSNIAHEQPLVCVLDDAQWLDGASAQVLGFVARRLAAGPVAMVSAVREPAKDGRFAGVPELMLGPLPDAEVRSLFASALPGPLDEAVRDRIVAETAGNPGALLELTGSWTLATLAGGFGLPDRASVPPVIEERFQRRLAPLSAQTRRLLLLAAAEPTGNPVLVWDAADRLGIPRDAAEPAIVANLLDMRMGLCFAHPLARSVIYRDATQSDRKLVHAALAEATDSEHDSDRYAWHLAAATTGPNEHVALELERSATRAQSRGGLAAAAGFLHRAVALTRDTGRRADRALAATVANMNVGAVDSAIALLATAEADAHGDLQRARAMSLRGSFHLVSRAGPEAAGLLLKAAKHAERLDIALARETYLDAWGAAMSAGFLATTGNLREVSRAARAAPRPAQPGGVTDLLLDGLAMVITDGRARAAPSLRDAVDGFRNAAPSGLDELRWSTHAATASVLLWEFDDWEAIVTRQASDARAIGAYLPLSAALQGQGMVATLCGKLAVAATAIGEAAALAKATGSGPAPYAALVHAAFRGREADASWLIEETIDDAIVSGQGSAVQYARWASAILNNGLGRYERAQVVARQASDDPTQPVVAVWALPEVIEAATRSGNTESARIALERLTEAAGASGSDWGLGLEAQSRALLSNGAAAERLYREGIERLSHTRLRPGLGRAHLLYGEWLRREGQRVESRHHLKSAYDLFAGIGMEAFAERARRELQATGQIVRRRSVEALDHLTPQELQIARLASAGRTNPEIGAQLFLSSRTVEWHLHRVFAKLGIASRKELRAALPTVGHPAVAV